MKPFLILIIVSNMMALSVGAQQKPKVYFISNDSTSQSGRIFSRVIITSEDQFATPKAIEVLAVSSSGRPNFGSIEIENYKALKGKFEPYRLLKFVDRIEEPNRDQIKRASLNESVELAPVAAFTSGLYRGRVKIFLSRYNSMPDVTSEWSYFYIH
jgi:hypothetical protein